MQTIVFEGQDRIVLQEKPVPALSDGDVLIKVDLCGICASDIAAINESSHNSVTSIILLDRALVLQEISSPGLTRTT